MDEEIERLLVSVRADTGAFARDVAEMQGQLDGPLADGLERAGPGAGERAGAGGADRQVRVRGSEADGAGGDGGDRGGGDPRRDPGGGRRAARAGCSAAAAQVAGGVARSAGRATGGPVAPGRPYLVGERGPELFVPTASGRVETGRGAVARHQDEHHVNAPAGEAPQALARVEPAGGAGGEAGADAGGVKV